MTQDVRERKQVASAWMLVAASSTLAVPPASTAQLTQPAVSLYELSTQAISGPLVSAAARVAPLTAAERLADFKESSGLTWEQAARLFGVSKRAVLLWKSGGTMSANHEERLSQLQSQLAEYAAGSVAETKSRLMSVDEEGLAPYQRWVEQVRRPDSGRAWIDRQPSR